MLVEYLDSFDYAEADLAIRGWTVTDSSGGAALSMETTAPITGYASLHFDLTSDTVHILRALSGNYASLSVRLRAKVVRSTANGERMFYVQDSGTIQLAVYMADSSGGLVVVHGSGTVLITASAALPDNNEHDIELIFVIANAGGSAELFVDGVSKGTFSGDTQQSANAYVNQVVVGHQGSATHEWWGDDLRVYRPSTGNATQMGMSKVHRKDVTGDTSQEDWTPSTGSDSFAMVDEQSSDGDTTYLSTTTDAHKTRLTGEAVAAGTTSVLGWQAVAIARKTDGASRDLLLGATDAGGGNEDKSAAQALTTSYAAYYYQGEDYPGGSGLTAGNITNMELLVEANQ